MRKFHFPVILLVSWLYLYPKMGFAQDLPITYTGVLETDNSVVYLHIFEENQELKAVMADVNARKTLMAIPFNGISREKNAMVFTFFRKMNVPNVDQEMALRLEGKMSKKKFSGELFSRTQPQTDFKSEAEVKWEIVEDVPYSTAEFQELTQLNMARLDSLEKILQEMQKSFNENLKSITHEFPDSIGRENLQEAIPAPKIVFDNPIFEFGKIEEGEVVLHSFTFRNTGTADLLIENVKGIGPASKINWTRDPVPPGGTGSVEWNFNTTGQNGYEVKTILVITNASHKATLLYLEGEVVPGH